MLHSSTMSQAWYLSCTLYVTWTWPNSIAMQHASTMSCQLCQACRLLQYIVQCLLCNMLQICTNYCRWPRFELPIQKLCGGDWDRSLNISVWDWNRWVQLVCLREKEGERETKMSYGGESRKVNEETIWCPQVWWPWAYWKRNCHTQGDHTREVRENASDY